MLCFELRPTTYTAELEGGKLQVDFDGKEWSLKIMSAGGSMVLNRLNKVFLSLRWVPGSSLEGYRKGYIPLCEVPGKSVAIPYFDL